MSANLHHVGKKADWELVPVDERNIFQQIASATKGMATPANAVSLYGAGKVLKGLHDIDKGDTLNGILNVGVGRLADIVDGAVADMTGTKSIIGEGVDATLDKLTLAATVPVLVRSEIISKRFATFTIVQNLANTALTAVAKSRGSDIHSTWAGKRSTGLLWSAIGLKGAAKAVRADKALDKIFGPIDHPLRTVGRMSIEASRRDKLAHKLDVAGRIAAIGYAMLGVWATAEYFRTVFSKKKT